jgi:hypothetical protein
MIYTGVLFTHSWLRWLVLVLGMTVLVKLVRSRRSDASASPLDLHVHRAFVGVLDLQFLLGVLLYGVLSPLSRAGWMSFGAAMGDTTLRFYTVEHVFGMFVAVALAHVAWNRRSASDEVPRGVLRLHAGWLLVTVASIPWPFLPYGRPLFRFFL